MQNLKITLRAARVNAGLSAKDAANRLKISISTLQNYEKGKTYPPTRLIPKIEDLYNIEYNNIDFFAQKLRLERNNGDNYVTTKNNDT